MAQVWSQFVTTRWPASLSFYESSTEILRQLSDQGYLVRFRHDWDRVVAKVSPHELVQITPSGMKWMVIGPDVPMQGLATSLDVAIRLLGLQHVTVDLVGLHLLAPTDEAHPQLLDRVSQLAVGEFFPDVTDFATLVDGRAEDLHAGFQVEVGIINDVEGPPRIIRQLGRMGVLGDAVQEAFGEQIAGMVRQLVFPPSALFGDWLWHPLPDPEEDEGASPQATQEELSLTNAVLDRVEALVEGARIRFSNAQVVAKITDQ